MGSAPPSYQQAAMQLIDPGSSTTAINTALETQQAPSREAQASTDRSDRITLKRHNCCSNREQFDKTFRAIHGCSSTKPRTLCDELLKGPLKEDLAVPIFDANMLEHISSVVETDGRSVISYFPTRVEGDSLEETSDPYALYRRWYAESTHHII